MILNDNESFLVQQVLRDAYSRNEILYKEHVETFGEEDCITKFTKERLENSKKAYEIVTNKNLQIKER